MVCMVRDSHGSELWMVRVGKQHYGDPEHASPEKKKSQILFEVEQQGERKQ